MVPKNQSPELSESDQILKDLVQKIAHFPQGDRELLLQDIHRLELSLAANKQALQESERLRQEAVASNEIWRERFQILADSSPLLVWMTDPQGGNLYINQTYQEYIGVSIDQVRGLNWQGYIHPEDAPGYIEAFQKAIRERNEIRSESRVRRKDGEWRWLTHYAKPYFSNGGVYQGHVGSSMDITDRTRAEDELRKTIEALRESERIYRAIGEANDYGIWICEPDGRNRYASQSYLDLLGITQQQCSDFGWGNSLHPDDAERTIQAWKECVRTGGTWDIEHRFLGKDGRYHPILARGVPVRNERGEIICWAGINLDISRLKQSEGYQRALNEIGQAIHSTLDTGEILRRSISAAAAALGSDTGAISLRKECRWIVSGVHGFPEEMLGMEMDDTQEQHAVLAIQTRMPVAVNDAFHDKRCNRDHLRKWGIRSVLVMPVVMKGEAIGVMFFNYQKAACVFNQSHIDFVSQLASALSLALENSRLFQDLQEEITERKRVEISLRESEAQLRESEAAQRRSAANERARANELEAVMDAAPAVIWISRDTECREMFGNRYSYDFLNIRQGENVSKTAPKEAVGVQKYRMEKNGCRIPVSELPMQIAAATGKPAKDYTFDLVYQDGTVFHMFGNVNPLLDLDGKPYGAIGVFVDLTTLRRLEEEQISAKAEIEVQRRLMDQREQERMIIARDLHDGPIQTLSGSVFHLQMIKEVFTDPALQVELNQIGMDIRNSIHELREVLNDLRPPALMHFGFTRMIQMYTEEIRERFADIEIEMVVMDDNRVLSDEARLALFRIYQAAINNIIRHSGASKAWVSYKMSPDSFILELRDNGKGFEMTQDYTQLTRTGHFGLVGMKERAEAIGGEFSVSTEPGNGTVIVVKGPLLGKNLK